MSFDSKWKTTLHVAVDLPIEQVKALTSPFNFVYPFYTGAVQEIPDYSEVSDGNILKPLYVGNHNDPAELIEAVVSNTVKAVGIDKVLWKFG